MTPDDKAKLNEIRASVQFCKEHGPDATWAGGIAIEQRAELLRQLDARDEMIERMLGLVKRAAEGQQVRVRAINILAELDRGKE